MIVSNNWVQKMEIEDYDKTSAEQDISTLSVSLRHEVE